MIRRIKELWNGPHGDDFDVYAVCFHFLCVCLLWLLGGGGGVTSCTLEHCFHCLLVQYKVCF